MLIIFHLLLLIRVGRCTDKLNFETRIIGVGEDVNLTCTRHVSDYDAALFWIRLVSGASPDFLGGTYTFDYDGDNKTPRITTKQEPGTFVLHISEAQPSDTGVYYCMKVEQLDMTFLKEIFLTTKAPEPDITANTKDPPSGPVHPGASAALQCSVVFDSERKTCSEKHSVYWFRAGSDKNPPSVIYPPGNNSVQCKKSPEAHSLQKCFYSFSKNISASDAGTYYCAVATCGQILFGNGTKLDIQELHSWDLQKASTVLLCATLAISVSVNAFLIFTIKKKNNDTGKDAPATSSRQKSPQQDEDSLIYSTASFTREKADLGAIGNAKRKETVYTGVRTLEID
ncbi:uncharacterized protein [Channa argus]|uniref:uncharacterized protein n=1 Tax=Channa argus TaxID=215402 RepID=UPI0035206533